jgi:hypothetical protein
MSFGSRATQAKPEALPSCSEQNNHDGGDVYLAHSSDFHREIFFLSVSKYGSAPARERAHRRAICAVLRTAKQARSAGAVRYGCERFWSRSHKWEFSGQAALKPGRA